METELKQYRKFGGGLIILALSLLVLIYVETKDFKWANSEIMYGIKGTAANFAAYRLLIGILFIFSAVYCMISIFSRVKKRVKVTIVLIAVLAFIDLIGTSWFYQAINGAHTNSEYWIYSPMSTRYYIQFIGVFACCIMAYLYLRKSKRGEVYFSPEADYQETIS